VPALAHPPRQPDLAHLDQQPFRVADVHRRQKADQIGDGGSAAREQHVALQMRAALEALRHSEQPVSARPHGLDHRFQRGDRPQHAVVDQHQLVRIGPAPGDFGHQVVPRAEIAAEVLPLHRQDAQLPDRLPIILGYARCHRDEDDREPRFPQQRKLPADHVRDLAAGRVMHIQRDALRIGRGAHAVFHPQRRSPRGSCGTDQVARQVGDHVAADIENPHGQPPPGARGRVAVSQATQAGRRFVQVGQAKRLGQGDSGIRKRPYMDHPRPDRKRP
jgi:hypothetical protein